MNKKNPEYFFKYSRKKKFKAVCAVLDYSKPKIFFVECRLVKFCYTKWNGIKTQLLPSYIATSGKNIAHDENKYSKFFPVDIVCG